jgi:hypothetical protein
MRPFTHPMYLTHLTRQLPLTSPFAVDPSFFDPLPPIAVDEDVPLAADDNQAKLMQWHYRLGHLSFQKLKQLALNGQVPKELSKLKPPKCAGCLFGAKTKLPWHGKESTSSHKIFVAAKPGEIVSVNQMESTEVGFFCPVEGVSHKEVVQVLHCFCGPLLPIAFCAPPN